MSSSPSYLSRLSRSVLNTLKKARDPFGPASRTGGFEQGAAPALAGRLFDFETAEDVRNWRTASDAAFGGCSRGDIRWMGGPELKGEDGVVPFLRFSGVYSKRLSDRAHPKMKRSGFVSLTGRPLDSLDSYIDLESYRALRYTVRVHKNSLHRTFLANVRSDNWVTGGQQEDVWQAVLHDGGYRADGRADGRAGGTADGPVGGDEVTYDGWKEVEVPLEGFVLTWRGRPVGERVGMGRSKVVSIGLALLGGDDRVEEEGEFCLDLRSIEGVV